MDFFDENEWELIGIYGNHVVKSLFNVWKYVENTFLTLHILYIYAGWWFGT
jgi:hypothetical protein